MATTNRAPAVVLGANEEDAQRWTDQLKAADPTAGPFYPAITRRCERGGLRVRRIYVTPAAQTAAGYHQTLADLRRSMALTRGGDTHGPVFLKEPFERPERGEQ